MYRVICELINNTLRHAEATKVRIDLRYRNDMLYLEYEDNGLGFDMQQIENEGGMGLSNMRYRLNSGKWRYRDIQLSGKRDESYCFY